MPANLQAVDVVVSGLVQGVGFRFFAQRAARRFGVVGTIKNRADGCVEAHLEGEAKSLDRVVAELRRGPFGAQVEQVRVQSTAVLGDEHELRITHER